MILCLRNIYFQVSNYICILYNKIQFPFITYGIIYGTMYKRQYTNKTLILWKSPLYMYVYIYASERAYKILAFLHNKSAISFNMDWEEQPFTNKQFKAYFKNA